jgi:hypothetical protein
MWPVVLLMLGVVVFTIASDIFANRVLHGIRWGFVAAFFAVTAAVLRSSEFPFRQSGGSLHCRQYLSLLGATWAAL